MCRHTPEVARYNLKFSLESVELGQGSWVRFDGYTITAFPAKHGLPSFGYILEEDPRPGRFNREQALGLGVPPGPLFGRLQRGEVITLGTGDDIREIRPEQVMGVARPGRKIVYTGDTRAVHMNIREIASDADLLIHDATYDESRQNAGQSFFTQLLHRPEKRHPFSMPGPLFLFIPVHGIRLHRHTSVTQRKNLTVRLSLPMIWT